MKEQQAQTLRPEARGILKLQIKKERRGAGEGRGLRGGEAYFFPNFRPQVPFDAAANAASSSETLLRNCTFSFSTSRTLPVAP